MARLLIAEARWDEKRNYWKINVQMDGKRRSFYSNVQGRRGKRLAEAKAQEWLNTGSVEDMKLKTALENYLDFHAKTVSKQSQEGEVNLAKRLTPIANKRVTRLVWQDWQDIINNAAESGLSESTCKGIRSFISRFAAWARKNRLPMCDIPDLSIPKSAQKSEKQALQPEDLKKLFSVDTTKLRNKLKPDFYIHAYRFCVITGLRRGELVGLHWQDFEDGAITIRRSITPKGEETKGKNKNARRTFVVPASAKRELEEQKRMLASKGIISTSIFPDERGKQSSPINLYMAWKRYCETNGLPDISFHEIRHTAISMYKGDVPVELLKDMVGHSDSMDTFGVYGHHFSGKMQETADAVDAVFTAVIG